MELALPYVRGYWPRIKRVSLIALFILMFGMIITKPPVTPNSQACPPLHSTITVSDLNRDGFINCHDPEELR